MANDGAVVIDVLLDSAKAMTEYNKLGSVMSGTGSKIGSALKAGTAAAIAGTAAVGVAAVGIGKQVLASYADYEQLVGGVDTLFGNASKTVQGFADNAYKTAGLSANAYMETVTGFSASMVHLLKEILQRLLITLIKQLSIWQIMPIKWVQISVIFRMLIKVLQNKTTQCLIT